MSLLPVLPALLDFRPFSQISTIPAMHKCVDFQNLHEFYLAVSVLITAVASPAHEDFDRVALLRSAFPSAILSSFIF